MLLHTIVLLFCYKNNSVDYHWDACYFAIYAILLFRGLPGTGTLAILLFMLFCYSVVIKSCIPITSITSEIGT